MDRYKDDGDTWAARTAADFCGWAAAASSANGDTLVTAAYGDCIHVSDTAGATWEPQISVGSNFWESVAMSSTGQPVLAVPAYGCVYMSSSSTRQTGYRTWHEDEGARLSPA